MTYRLKAANISFMVVQGYNFRIDAMEVIDTLTPIEFKNLIEHIEQHEY